MFDRRWLVPVGMLLIGATVFAGMHLVGTWQITPGSTAANGEPGSPASQALLERRPELVPAMQSLYASLPEDEANELVRRYGSLAPAAWSALGHVGIELLDHSDEMPNYVFYVESPISREAALGDGPIAEYLQRLAKYDPAKADTLFYTFTRMGSREAALLRHYPQALPILAVAPARATDVIERYGDEAVCLMLRFTPDSYSEIARLLSTDGERVFAVRDAMMAANDGAVINARQDLMESFLALYFLEFGDTTAWLENRVGIEQTVFFMNSNLDYFQLVRDRDGESGLRSMLLSLVGYAQSNDPRNQKIAELVFQMPGALPLFVEGHRTAGARDNFFAKYGDRGGISLIAQGYDPSLWPELLSAAGEHGDSVMMPLAVLVNEPLLKDTLKKVKEQDTGHTVLELLRAVSKALVDDGGPETENFRLVLRTLQQAYNGHWNDIPDDYLSRQYHWIWDVLPGRDAFRLAQMMLHGYSPTLFEAANGIWDAANVLTFAYTAGGAVVDCTKAVAGAISEGSWSALGKALGIVGKDVAGNVFKRLVTAISKPRNYIRLALTAGYFAYDAFLTYAPMEIPNRAKLLEFNKKFLNATMRGMLLDVIKDVGMEALVWRKEFDHRGLELEEPNLPGGGGPEVAAGALSQADRIALELDRLDVRVKNAFIKLLDETERRRNFLKMLGMGQKLLPGQGSEGGSGGSNAPREFDPLDPNNEAEEMNGNRSRRDPRESEEISLGDEPVAWGVTADGERIALRAPRFRNLSTTAAMSRVTGQRLDIPTDHSSWDHMVHNDPNFVAFCLEQIVDLAHQR